MADLRRAPGDGPVDPGRERRESLRITGGRARRLRGGPVPWPWATVPRCRPRPRPSWRSTSSSESSRCQLRSPACRSGTPSPGKSSLLVQPRGLGHARSSVPSWGTLSAPAHPLEFRSLELFLDEHLLGDHAAVRAALLDVVGHKTELGGVPGIIYHSAPQGAARRDPLPFSRRRVHRDFPRRCTPSSRRRVCKETGLRRLRRRLPAWPPSSRIRPVRRTQRGWPLRRCSASASPSERILLAGDSGGGGLANTLVLANPEDGSGLMIDRAGVVLFSPEVDLRLDEPSVTENAEQRHLARGTSRPPAYLHGKPMPPPHVGLSA